MLEHKGTFSASSSDNAKKNLDAAFIHHTGGVYGKLEQVGLQMIINLTHTCVNSKDWKDSHAAYKILEAKRGTHSKLMLKSTSRSQFGVSK